MTKQYKIPNLACTKDNLSCVNEEKGLTTHHNLLHNLWVICTSISSSFSCTSLLISRFQNKNIAEKSHGPALTLHPDTPQFYTHIILTQAFSYINIHNCIIVIIQHENLVSITVNPLPHNDNF